ncbi:MAG: response regulator transcription factor [Bacteroidales bacterium]|nr:response regulator transcription factor [Bacteroidales bacterium]MDD4216464.1 response regulator transcription factor [Bacteroidales bacterium]MDY0141818.1 response regulator transcription factor [Bacteroidales bacterium]
MNCIIIDDDPIILKQLSTFIYKSDLLNVKGMYNNPVQAFDAIQNNNIDLIFLDIEMPEMSGLEYLEEYKTKYQIIVVSGDRKYALDTFQFGVTDYLLKPIEYSRFLKSVYRSIERNNNFMLDIEKKRFFVKTNDEFQRIKLNDIVYIDCSGNNHIIFTRKKTYKLKNDIIDFDIIASNNGFFNIDSRKLVNIEMIVDVKEGNLLFDDDYHVDSLTVPRKIEEEILKRMQQR